MKITTILTLMLLGTPAAASEFCAAVEGLSDQGGTTLMALPGHPEAVKCTQSLSLGGGSQLHCGWPFKYRDPAANLAFDQGVSALTDCYGALEVDQEVNHPDFYDLRIFQAKDQEIGLSLKDKSSLGQTYVFLRISRKP